MHWDVARREEYGSAGDCDLAHSHVKFGLIESPTTLHSTFTQATGNTYISGSRQLSIFNVSWSYGNPPKQV